MQIRMRETGDLVFSDEFRRIHSDTSFPIELSPDILEAFDADEVHDGVTPTLTENQYAKYDGVEEINGQWFTKYVAVDYTAEELAAKTEQWRQSANCTPFQGRMALSDSGKLAAVETAISAADEKTRTAWEYALIWQRNSPMIETLGAALGMTDVEIDDLFKAATQITA